MKEHQDVKLHGIQKGHPFMVGRTGYKREQTYMLENSNMLLRMYRNSTAFEEHVRTLEHARNSSFIHARLFDACKKKKLCM